MKSVASVGSKFEVNIPLQIGKKTNHSKVGLKSKLKPIPLGKKFRGAKILVVEDCKMNQLVTQGFLEAVGLTASFADDGRAAMDLLKKNQNFNLILMDVQMPEVNGFSATKWYRETYKDWDLPIIAMTAHALESEKQKCLDSGMNDFLTKPIESETFYNTLETWLEISFRAVPS